MPGFVVRGVALLRIAQDHGFTFRAHQDLVLGQLEIHHHDHFAVLPRRLQRRLVHQVCQVRAGQSRCPARQHREIHVVAQRDLLGVNLQDLLAAGNVGPPHHHAPVEAARPQQRRVQHVRTVGGRHQDHAFVRFEAVHLHQKLVQRLLALVVPAAQARPAVPADGIDFVDEDDAGGVLLALLKEVAHAARAHAYEHLHEVRTRNREKRYAGFTRDGARQQRLARARRPDQQHALGNPPAQLLEFLRLPQELDDLLQFFLGLFHARHVLERDLLLLRRVQPRATLPETQGLVAAALHLPHHEDPEGEQQNERGEVQKERYPPARIARLGFDRDTVLFQALDRGRVVRGKRGAQSLVPSLVDPVDLVVPRDGDGLHLARLHIVHELRVTDLLLAPLAAGANDRPQ